MVQKKVSFVWRFFFYFSSRAYFLHIFSGKKHGLGCCWYQNHIWLCLPMRLASLIMKLLRSSISLQFLPETPNPNRLKRNFLLILMMNCRSLIIIIFLHWFFFIGFLFFLMVSNGLGRTLNISKARGPSSWAGLAGRTCRPGGRDGVKIKIIFNFEGKGSPSLIEP